MPRPISIVILIDLIAIAAAVMIFAFTGEKQLGEGGFLTKLSGAQLLAISIVAFGIFRIRNCGVSKVFSLKNPGIVWALISAGFFFLMADEMFKIHESIDEMIHSVLGLKETGLTDRIDDVLILMYGLIGIGVIYIYRREFVVMKEGWRFLLVGFGLLLLTVALDMLTNRDDVLRAVFDKDLAQELQTWLSFAEEGAKILAEGFFLVAFYVCLQSAKTKQSTA